MVATDSGGFTVGSERTVHEWAMFRLLQRNVTSPTGEEFERTFVDTPGAVATVAITPRGDIVLVSQYRAAMGRFVLEIPAGMRDVAGEDPAVTATRELREETGYVASSVEILGEFLSTPGVTNSHLFVYLATGLEPGDSEPHGPEEDSMSVTEVPAAEALAMVRNGRIVDGKTSYAILMAHLARPDLFG